MTTPTAEAAPEVRTSAPQHGLRPAAGPDLRDLVRDNRDLRRLGRSLALSRAADLLGLFATLAVVWTLAVDAGAGAVAMSLLLVSVLVVRLLPAVVLGGWPAAVVDRLEPRRALLLADVLRAALLASIPLLGVLGWVYPAVLLVEVAGLVAARAAQIAAGGLLPTRHRASAGRLLRLITVGSAFPAALIFVLLALPADRHDTLVLVVAAAAHLLAALVLRRADLPTTAPAGDPTDETPGGLRRLPAEVAVLLTVAVLRPLLGGLLVLAASLAIVVATGRSWVAALAAGDGAFGVLVLAVVVGVLLGLWRGPRWTASLAPRRTFALGVLLAGVAALLAGAVPQVGFVVVAVALLAVGAGLARAAAGRVLELEVDAVTRSRALRVLEDGGRVVLVVVLLLAGLLTGLLGPEPAGSSGWPGAAGTMLLSGAVLVGVGMLAVKALAEGDTTMRVDLQRAWKHRGQALPNSRRHSLPGYFVAFEGGDGSGKSTQAQMLADWAGRQGWEAVRTREPGGTALGRRLRSVLLDHPEVDPAAGDPAAGDLAAGSAAISPRAEALLFAADRAQHVAQVIRPALSRGAVVITDRYIDSSLAYQGAGRAESLDEIERLSEWATEGLVPDLTVVLDVDPATAAARRGRDALRQGDDRLEAESTAFHTAVREQFLLLAEREPRRYLVLDATTSERSVQRRVRAHLEALLDAPDTAEEGGSASPAGEPVPVRRNRLAWRAPRTGPVPLAPADELDAPTSKSTTDAATQDPATQDPATQDPARETGAGAPADVTQVLELPGNDETAGVR